MARKLKSDKFLFLATLLLVCSSVVMVYSASAVLAMNRFNQPYFFLTKQAMWAALGLAAMSIAMRFDYRHYREPSFIWMALGVVVFALVAVLFSAPINGSRRWFGVAGFGVQPSELAKLSAIFFIAALLERRMDRIDEIPHALVPIGVVVGGLVGLILLEPDLGTAMTLLLIAVVDDICGRAQLSVRGRRDPLRASGHLFHSDERRIPAAPAHGVLGSVERSAR